MKAIHQVGTEMPVVYRHVLSCDWLRTFTFKDRIRILFGCSLVVAIRIACRHDPGLIQPVIAGEVSIETSPSERLKLQMDSILVEEKE
jgi:hypothetical protein